MKLLTTVAVSALMLAGCAPFGHGHYASDIVYDGPPQTAAIGARGYDDGRYAHSVGGAYALPQSLPATYSPSVNYVEPAAYVEPYAQSAPVIQSPILHQQPIVQQPVIQQASFPPPIQTLHSAPVVQASFPPPIHSGPQFVHSAPAPAYAEPQPYIEPATAGYTVDHHAQPLAPPHYVEPPRHIEPPRYAEPAPYVEPPRYVEPAAPYIEPPRYAEPAPYIEPPRYVAEAPHPAPLAAPFPVEKPHHYVDAGPVVQPRPIFEQTPPVAVATSVSVAEERVQAPVSYAPPQVLNAPPVYMQGAPRYANQPYPAPPYPQFGGAQQAPAYAPPAPAQQFPPAFGGYGGQGFGGQNFGAPNFGGYPQPFPPPPMPGFGGYYGGPVAANARGGYAPQGYGQSGCVTTCSNGGVY